MFMSGFISGQLPGLIAHNPICKLNKTSIEAKINFFIPNLLCFSEQKTTKKFGGRSLITIV
jgi:hypothetical protein